MGGGGWGGGEKMNLVGREILNVVKLGGGGEKWGVGGKVTQMWIPTRPFSVFFSISFFFFFFSVNKETR